MIIRCTVLIAFQGLLPVYNAYDVSPTLPSDSMRVHIMYTKQ